MNSIRYCITPVLVIVIFSLFPTIPSRAENLGVVGIVLDEPAAPADPQAGHTGDMVLSRILNSTITHFVTPMKFDPSDPAPLDASHVYLKATITAQAFTDGGYSWESESFEPSGNRGAAGTASNQYKVSRAASGLTKVRIKKGLTLVKEMYVWVVEVSMVWAISGTNLVKSSWTLGITSARGQGNSYTISGAMLMTGTIKPASLITANERPGLGHSTLGHLGPPFGQVRQSPPGADGGVPTSSTATAPVADASGSYFTSWDMSRQVTLRMTPDSTPVSSNKNYPANIVEGNDDASPLLDEDDNPYQGTLGQAGEILSTDNVAANTLDSAGINGDEVLVKAWFREFARLQIGTVWYKVSKYFPWRFHGYMKKVNNQWIQHPTLTDVLEDNNNGIP